MEWFALKTWAAGGSLWFLTLTFQENLTDLGEAWKRWKPIADWLRHRGISAVGAWQQQKRGAWHIHLIVDGYIQVVLMRDFAKGHGWGSFLNVQKIVRPPATQDEAKAELRRAIRYVARYVQRDIVEAHRADAAAGRKVCLYLCGTKKATVRFNFTGGLHHVWRLGCALWCEVWGWRPDQLYRNLKQDVWRQTSLRAQVMAMGLEAVWGNPSFAHLLYSSRLILILGQLDDNFPF